MKVIGYENNNRVFAHSTSTKDEDFAVHDKLEVLLNDMLYEKPLWEFKVHQPYMNLKANLITVMQDGEELGTVQYRHIQGKSKYYITNYRIAAQKARSNGYATLDKSKAMLTIKKMFSKLSNTEIIDKAVEVARDRLTETDRHKHYERRQAEEAINKRALAYVESVAAAEFAEYLRTTDVTAYNTIAKRDTLRAECVFTGDVQKALVAGNASVVCVSGPVYIVKCGADVLSYTDDTLPESMKPRLGMLKLVDEKHYITGIGFRASQNTFVVLNEEKADEQV